MPNTKTDGTTDETMDALDGAYNAAFDAAQLALEALAEGRLRLARVALRAALEAVGELEALVEGRSAN